MIDADVIYAHWPERVVSAYAEVVYCTCGQEFRADDLVATEAWAAHLAAEVNARLKLLEASA